MLASDGAGNGFFVGILSVFFKLFFVMGEEKFSYQDLLDVEPETVDYIQHLAEVRLVRQQEHLEEIDRKCTTLLGWIIGALVALVGSLAAQLFLMETNWKVVAIVTSCCLALLWAGGTLFRRNLYKRGICLAGEAPEDICNKQVLNWAGRAKKGCRANSFKAWTIETMNAAILSNQEEILHRVKYYRRSLYVIMGGLLFTLIESVVFLFI